ncbi:hypothetical protein D3C72_1125400 [compost metagenome]
MLAQVALHIRAEGAQVGDPARVDRGHALGLQPGVPLRQFGLLLAQVIAQHRELLQPGQHRRLHEAHAVLVQVQRALDPAATRFLHAAPVLERLGHQLLGRDGGDGLVEVLHGDGMQGDIDDIAVSVLARHLDPVADAHAAIATDLHAGHQRQDGVLEDQHQHRGCRAQAGDQWAQLHPQQGGDDGQARGHEHHDLDHLQVALDRLVACIGLAFVQAVGRIQRMRERHRHGQYRPHDAQLDDDVDQAWRQVGNEGDARGDHLAGHHVGQARDDPHQVAATPGLGARQALQQASQAAHQDALGHPVGQAGCDQQGRDHQRQVGARIGFQCVLQLFQPLYRHHCVHHRLSPSSLLLRLPASGRHYRGLPAGGWQYRVSPASAR